MTKRVPEEVIAKIKSQRKEEYSDGFNAGVELARERDYSTVEAALEAIKEDNMSKLFDILGENEYFESSSEYQEGFADALSEILEKSEEGD